MKKIFYLAAAALAGIGMIVASCSKDRAKDSANAESTGFQDMDVQKIEVTEEPDGSLEIDNTLEPEVVTAEAPGSSKDGYTTTSSGLKYKVIKKGNGTQHPKATDYVNVKYTGKLENGKVFDSTDNHGGQPIGFPLNRVIPGWTEGVQLMVPGDVYQFVIPANLGYGAQGVPGTIPPNATLIFDVELVSIGA